MATMCTPGQDKEWQETLVVEGKEQKTNLPSFLCQLCSAHNLSFSSILCLPLQLARTSELGGHFKSGESRRDGPLPPGRLLLTISIVGNRSSDALAREANIKPKLLQAMYSSCKMQGPPSPQEPKVLQTHSKFHKLIFLFCRWRRAQCLQVPTPPSTQDMCLGAHR